MNGPFGFGRGLPMLSFWLSRYADRIYVLGNGFVLGEVPPGVVPEVGREVLRGFLEASLERDFVRAKAGNLTRYAEDLRQVVDRHDGHALPLRSAADFRLRGVLPWEGVGWPPALLPRLVELGTHGCYVYVHIGWRHVLRPDANELEVLNAVGVDERVPDAGVATFAATERADVAREMADAILLHHRLRGAADEGAASVGA